MNVFDTNGSMDSAKFLEYIVNQFPGDLKSMVEARDELAKRQGAMSAVEAANADREAAKAELAAAKKESKAWMADATVKHDAATAKAKNLDERELAFNIRCADMEAAYKSNFDALVVREGRVSVNETSLAAFQVMLETRAAKLDADRMALEDRVKAFQDKVAALSA